MTTVAEKARAKRARRPVYLVVRKLVDPATGEEVGALVPANPIDQRLLRERKFHVNREIRAELKQPRNAAFHRLAHVLGHLLVDNVEGFESLTAHDALKRVQAEAGVCCDRERFVIDLGQFGRHEADRNIPRSIAFDEMPEHEFGELFRGVCDHIDRTYAGAMTDGVRREYAQMIDGEAP